jgi:hypothetical protein
MIRSVAISILWLLVAVPAVATPVTWAVTLHISGTLEDPTYAPLVGTDLRGIISFDTNAAPVRTAQNSFGYEYAWYDTGPWVFDVPALHATWTYAHSEIQTTNFSSCLDKDCFGMVGVGGLATSGLAAPYYLELISFQTWSETLMLPDVPPAALTLYLGTTQTGRQLLYARPEIVPVPEPATLTLLLIGLSACRPRMIARRLVRAKPPTKRGV